MTLRTTAQCIITPAEWALSQTGAYKFCDIMHKLGETQNDVIWDADADGVTHAVIAGNQDEPAQFPATYVFSEHRVLTNAMVLFRFARLLSIDAKIEWLGAQIRTVSVNRIVSEVGEPSRSNGFGLHLNKYGATLMAKMCHERFDRMNADGRNNVALPVGNMLGFNELPDVHSPDRLSTIDGRGTTPSGSLAQAGGVKQIRFTPERRFKTLRFKPLSRIDKAASVFDLAKLEAAGANWDDDQRCGTLWLAQIKPLNALSSYTVGVGETQQIVQNESTDFFRITYTATWKFFGAARSNQDRGDL